MRALPTTLLLALAATLSAQRPVPKPATRPARAPERFPPLTEVTEAHPRLGPPRRLLSPPYKWQTSSGTWAPEVEAT